MIYVITMGFDEKFALRAVTRRGLKSDDEILVVMAKPTDERAERAFQHFSEILSRVFRDIKISRVEVDPRNLTVLKDLAQVLSPYERERFIFILSGGFRALIIETLLVATFLKLNAEVEIDLEDYSATITFPLKWNRPIELTKVELEILSNIDKGIMTIPNISKNTKVSKATIWRKVKKLEKEGFLIAEKNIYRLTELGLVAKLVHTK
ncbi:MAG: CRISPR-associated CARF protein Csa3 [Leptospiraceae bacterium]|nr:CRISPR-associated CARF protein Csa3 [Leptospiraceae bacterium]